MSTFNASGKSLSKSTITLIVVAVIACLICANGCSSYNSFVEESETVEKSWAGVQNQYQRRMDLINNLVATVKGYAEHESKTFENVTKARAGIDSAAKTVENLKDADLSDEATFEKYTKAQNELNRATGLYINAVHEAYPDLKANENFRDLQTQLEGTENRIATERKYYTEAVQEYNVMVRKFPKNIWAGIFGFSKKPQYAADEEAQKAPKVEF